MSNPPSIPLAAGVPQFLLIVVTANAVQPDGSNPGVLDVTTPLTFEGLQGFTTSVNASEVGQTAEGKRIVKISPGVLAVGAPVQPWSFRVKAAGRTAFTTVGGTTAAPLDVSGTSWDGTPPSTTQPS